MKHIALQSTLAAAAILIGIAACNEMGTTNVDGNPTVRVLLTDAPADYIDSAWVDIGRIDLVPATEDGGGDGGPVVTLTDDGTDGYVNLFELAGEATLQLAELEIEPDTYAQLRLIVDSAKVKLKEGYEFEGGGTMETLFVPSGAQTGIKLNLEGSNGEGEGTMGGVEIVQGETILVLDFDVFQSFRMQGNAESPAGIKGFHFQPTLRVVVYDVAASIAGTVTGAADSIPVDSLVVTAEPVDDGLLEAYQSQTATTMTDTMGVYMMHFVVPGDYKVSVDVPDGFATAPDTAEVTVGEAEAVDEVDFTIDEASGG